MYQKGVSYTRMKIFNNLSSAIAHLYYFRGSTLSLCTHNPDSIMKKYRLQDTLLNKHLSWKWWQLATQRLLLADPLTSRINTICNHHMLYSVSGLCYPNLMQSHNDFIVQRNMDVFNALKNYLFSHPWTVDKFTLITHSSVL